MPPNVVKSTRYPAAGVIVRREVVGRVSTRQAPIRSVVPIRPRVGIVSKPRPTPVAVKFGSSTSPALNGFAVLGFGSLIPLL